MSRPARSLLLPCLAVLALLAPAAWAETPPEANDPKPAPISKAVAWLPDLTLLTHFGVMGVFNGTPLPTGQFDLARNGFGFQQLEVALDRDLGAFARLSVDLSVAESGFFLNEASAETLSLPGRIHVRAGRFRSRVGYANARRPGAQEFVEQPLALGKMFGPRGHLNLGAELRWSVPVPFRFDLYGAAMAATGPGARSFYGNEDIEIQHPRDFAYQLGFKMGFDLGDGKRTHLGFGFDAVLGPNAHGRKSGTDIYAVGAFVEHALKNVDGFKLALETEWFIRRRQVPGSVLQDAGGWLELGLHVTPQWSVGARYELTTGVEGDDLDAADRELRQRPTLQVGWRPLPWGRIRVSGYMDVGGPNAETHYGVLLHLEAGTTMGPTMGLGAVRGAR